MKNNTYNSYIFLFYQYKTLFYRKAVLSSSIKSKMSKKPLSEPFQKLRWRGLGKAGSPSSFI